MFGGLVLPGLAGGACSAPQSPDPLAGFKRDKEGRGRERVERKRREGGKGAEGRKYGGRMKPTAKCWVRYDAENNDANNCGNKVEEHENGHCSLCIVLSWSRCVRGCVHPGGSSKSSRDYGVWRPHQVPRRRKSSGNNCISTYDNDGSDPDDDDARYDTSATDRSALTNWSTRRDTLSR